MWDCFRARRNENGKEADTLPSRSLMGRLLGSENLAIRSARGGNGSPEGETLGSTTHGMLSGLAFEMGGGMSQRSCCALHPAASHKGFSEGFFQTSGSATHTHAHSQSFLPGVSYTFFLVLSICGAHRRSTIYYDLLRALFLSTSSLSVVSLTHLHRAPQAVLFFLSGNV